MHHTPLMGRDAVLSNYNPTMAEKLTDFMARNWYGDNREGTRKAEKLMNVLNFTPVGAATGMYDAGRAAGQGDYMGAGLNLAMAGIPAAKGIRAYHGSPHDIDQFRNDLLGTHFDKKTSKMGNWFSTNKEDAEVFGDKIYEVDLRGNLKKLPSMEDMTESTIKKLQSVANDYDERFQLETSSRASEFLEYFRKTKDPKVFTDVAAAHISKAKRGGFDGAILKNGEQVQTNSAPGDHVVVFDPKLIEILRKYGIAGLLGYGALASQQNNADPASGG